MIICLFLLLGSVILTFNDNLNISIKNKSYNIKIGPNEIIHTSNSYDKYLQNKNNKLFRSINGNHEKFNKIKILQYNKGSSNFHNHIHHIQTILQNHEPHILCISEANFKQKYDNGTNYFPGYNLEKNLQYNTIGISRNCILIKNEIKYSRRYDLEDTITCDI